MNHRGIQRRSFLKTASGLALAPALPLVPALAQAAGKEVVVGTWGGDYQNLLQQYISPLMEKQDIGVVFQTGNAVPRVTKLRAERDARRGSMDVALLGDVDMYDAAQAKALADIKSHAAEVPNLAQVYDQFKTAYSIPHIFSAMTLVYNTQQFSTPPDSVQVMLDPKYKGRVGFSDILYLYNGLFVGAGGSGGHIDSFEPGKKFLGELVKNTPRIYPSNEAVATAFKSGEIWMACMWKARALQWRDAGLPLDFVIPKEGAIPVTFEAAVAKNSRNPGPAWAYLNALLEPAGQVHFARAMGYAPTVRNASLPDDLRKRVAFTDAELSRIYPYSLDKLAAGKSAFLDYWTKSFKGAL
ncbi:extracellular solute-binding protein [Bordetella flabilis]|uniref:ABC transporter substrate-binding protein n=1 Tax=Bordetella flabilis TaxID=463014 RepID=A0A193G8Z0_9BORD|nr:extracellular solute-binding protein [Bordetella flabilis]ANN75931.1 ABC transporter substrate-binding protein [Bordetella flabilis]